MPDAMPDIGWLTIITRHVGWQVQVEVSDIEKILEHDPAADILIISGHKQEAVDNFKSYAKAIIEKHLQYP